MSDITEIEAELDEVCSGLAEDSNVLDEDIFNFYSGRADGLATALSVLKKTSLTEELESSKLRWS